MWADMCSAPIALQLGSSAPGGRQGWSNACIAWQGGTAVVVRGRKVLQSWCAARCCDPGARQEGAAFPVYDKKVIRSWCAVDNICRLFNLV